LDLHLPAKSGLVVLRELDARSYPAPIFIVTSDSDVSSAVEAVKSGAFDYLVKPLDARAIVARVRSAITAFVRRDGSAVGKIGLPADFPGQSLLTPREREVLSQIAEGASNIGSWSASWHQPTDGGSPSGPPHGKDRRAECRRSCTYCPQRRRQAYIVNI